MNRTDRSSPDRGTRVVPGDVHTGWAAPGGGLQGLLGRRALSPAEGILLVESLADMAVCAFGEEGLSAVAGG